MNAPIPCPGARMLRRDERVRALVLRSVGGSGEERNRCAAGLCRDVLLRIPLDVTVTAGSLDLLVAPSAFRIGDVEIVLGAGLGFRRTKFEWAAGTGEESFAQTDFALHPVLGATRRVGKVTVAIEVEDYASLFRGGETVHDLTLTAAVILGL